MYQSILVPIDLTHAEKGKVMLDVAKKLGGKGGKITLITVIEDIPAYVAVELPGDIIKNMRKDAQAELESMAKAAGLKAKIEVHSGRPVTAILDASKDMAGGVIVIASHQPGLQD